MVRHPNKPTLNIMIFTILVVQWIASWLTSTPTCSMTVKLTQPWIWTRHLLSALPYQ